MALISSRATQQKDRDSFAFPVAAGAKVYGGALVALNANGFAVGGLTAIGLRYQGRSEEFVDNTGGVDGGKFVVVRRNKAFKWKNSGADPVSQADVGNLVYIVDDETVAKTNGGNTRSAAGKLLGIEPDGVWVE